MERIPYFDTHCDTISRCDTRAGTVHEAAQRSYYAAVSCLRKNGGHIDLERSRGFGRYAQFFALFFDAAKAPADGMWAQCQRLHDCFLHEMAENSDLITHCRTGAEVDAAALQGKAAALLSIEGADLVECDIGKLEIAAGWGVRFLNPVWNRANVLSGTNSEEPERGLSDRGRDFIRAMEDFGIYADVSHLSDAGFWDLMKLARRPVVASHSNSRAVWGHRRNLTDDQFRAIRDSDGVVGMNFYANFIGENANLNTLIQHIEHFLALDGEKTVCLGGDLDGCEELPTEMQGCQDVPKLWQALAERGYPQSLLEDIFWNNARKLL